MNEDNTQDVQQHLNDLLNENWELDDTLRNMDDQAREEHLEQLGFPGYVANELYQEHRQQYN